MLMPVISRVICAALLLMPAVPASAENQTFFSPAIGGKRLDWCVNWAVGCGKEAADMYCKRVGYERAASFSEAVNIGQFAPTRLIGTGAVCDQAFCDGFSQITCFKPSPAEQTFFKPRWGAQRLDYCLNWAEGCGQGAANAFCQKHGFASSKGFAEDVDIGASEPTRLIATGAICDQAFCDGFQFVKCGN